jgi:hypothetical protein
MFGIESQKVSGAAMFHACVVIPSRWSKNSFYTQTSKMKDKNFKNDMIRTYFFT